MNKQGYFRCIWLFGFVLSLSGVLLGQSRRDKTLVVNGRTVRGTVRQMDGRSYVALEDLADITNGVLTIESNRIVLTFPSSDSGVTPSVTPSQATQDLSKGFAKIAIAELAEIREWRGAIGTMIKYGLAVSGTWAQEYQARAQQELGQAAEAASTKADRDALQLVRNEYDKLAGWSSDVFVERQALNGARTVDPNAAQNDVVLAKITNCGRFLNAMLVSGVYADDSNCH
jgi:hypothetical protein